MSDFKSVNDELSDVEENATENFADDVDWAETEDNVAVQSLFDSTLCSSVDDLITHDLQKYGFDLKHAVDMVGCNDISIIMLVNFIRRKVSESVAIDSSFIHLLNEAIIAKQFLHDDTSMVPVLPEDPLLYLLHDTLCQDDNASQDDEWHENEDQIEASKAAMRQNNPNYDEIVSRLS